MVSSLLLWFHFWVKPFETVSILSAVVKTSAHSKPELWALDFPAFSCFSMLVLTNNKEAVTHRERSVTASYFFWIWPWQSFLQPFLQNVIPDRIAPADHSMPRNKQLKMPFIKEQRQILISGVNRFFHWFFLLLNSHGFSPCYVEDYCFTKQKDPHSIPMLICIGDYVSASLFVL